jgi:hypothetical protein
MKDDDEDQSNSGDEYGDDMDGSGHDEQSNKEVHVDRTPKKKTK